MGRVMELATENVPVRRAVLEVTQMVKPPTALFRPGVVARVLRSTVGRRESAEAPTPAGYEQPEAV